MALEYRLTAEGIEVLNSGAAFPRATAVGLEVLHGGQPFANVSAVAIEVLRSVQQVKRNFMSFVP